MTDRSPSLTPCAALGPILLTGRVGALFGVARGWLGGGAVEVVGGGPTGVVERQRLVGELVKMGCGASTSNPPLTATKMRLISEMPDDKRRACEAVFSSLDKDGNGSITLEDSIWAKPFLDAHDIDGDGRVTLVRSIPPARLPPYPRCLAENGRPTHRPLTSAERERERPGSPAHRLHPCAANRRTSTSTPAVGDFVTMQTGTRRNLRFNSGGVRWARRASTSSSVWRMRASERCSSTSQSGSWRHRMMER